MESFRYNGIMGLPAGRDRIGKEGAGVRIHKSLIFACCLLAIWPYLVAGCGSGFFTVPGPTLAPTPTVEVKKPHEIAVVVRIGGVPWFNVMADGVTQAAEELGQNAYVVSPKTVDPAEQESIVEELISKGVEAIAVVPDDPASLAPVLEKAKDKGIVVLTQESIDQAGNDYDFELIDDGKFAQANWDALVHCMGSDAGQYAVLVGGLDIPLQKLWADEGLKYAAAKYPNLMLVTDPISYAENQDVAREKAAELLQRYPDLRGIIGFGSLGPPGAAQAVGRNGLQDRVCVVGTVLPSHAAPFIKDGSLDEGLFWSPRDAGYGLVWLAKQILDGPEPATGMEIPGLGPITVDGKIVRANSIIRIDKNNVDSFGF
jgi:simple sugar transport system substrate-binding protein